MTTATLEKKSAPLYRPRTNQFTSENAYHLEVGLPGIDKDDLELTVENSVLKLHATRKTKEAKGLRRIYREFNLGDYQAEYYLPDDVDTEAIEADLNAGLLNITLPKRPEALPKKINIKA